MMRTKVCLGLAALLIATACSGTSSDGVASDGSSDVVNGDETTTSVAPTTVAGSGDVEPAAADAAVENAAEVFADAAEYELPPDDISFPDVTPSGPVGSYGFSNYVWTQAFDAVRPTLIEGPRGEQVRCQDPALPCSYAELKELSASGDPIPPELELTESELTELVGQLDVTHEAVSSLETLDAACAAGYQRSSSQNPNMGIHMVNTANIASGVFDPASPQMVLFAKDGGHTLTQTEIGSCNGDVWEGLEGFEPVGAVFTRPLTPEHPDAFAGQLDNWHVHYNTCAGADDESGGRILGDPEGCAAEGGQFMEVMPIWMMHAYVMPEFDSQTGVFAMFNNSVWPLTDRDSILDERTQEVLDGNVAPINNFSFGELEVAVGEEIVWSNSDAVPHTVTDADGAFDSGVFGSGQLFNQSFDTAGEFEIFCQLHPQMTGTVTVTG